ncbi:pyridoxamine 5'-phosphate oxidase family protein [Ottowia thiooxydans]|uniref:pyridoxamine 5'-phosphate oxidase family protein n=1 Tax=Ottowia thiooxydans TaxID=219182 RepID=UPI0004039FE7|nr:pyridoxamine 5'-phosphate oxidase family protein [Ottowia thiooxydans]
MNDTIFHPGERLVQERTGERSVALINSRHISSAIPAPARAFIAQQPWCVIGAADASGVVYASLLIGEPGFVLASDDLATLQVVFDDPHSRLATTAPFSSLESGQSIAVLLIELQKRRRLRVNGQVAFASATGFEVAVGQAFPVCPRYIQKREPEADQPADRAHGAAPVAGHTLDEAVSEWIAAADTLFISTLGPAREADVSHRGGRPGFVKQQDQVLRIPDFSGNSMFNTLGNLAVESRCGLVFPDFEGARQLQLTGHARVCFDVIDEIQLTGGTGRWIEFTVDAWCISPLNLPLRWSFVEASPYNP